MLHLGWWPSADEDMPPRHPVARCHMYLSHVLASDEYTIESQSARIDDVECVLLRNSLATDAIWLDPSNHFAIRRRELRSAEQGGIIDIWNVRQFEPASRLQDASAVSIGRIIEVTSKTHSKDTEYQECLIKIEDVKINQSHDEECSFVPPPGTLAINMDSESLIGVLDGGTELLEQNVKMAIQMRRPAGERRGLRQLLQSTVVGRNVRRVLVWFNCGIAIAATAAIVYSLWRHRRGRAEKFD